MGYEFGVSRRIYGVVVGIVTKNDHPDGLYRVRVKYPWIRDSEKFSKETDHESPWARVCSNMAGKGRGFYCLPEVGDEVLISFIHGDMRQPVVVGSLWNGEDKPPSENCNDASSDWRGGKDAMGNDLGLGDSCVNNVGGKNNGRFFLSRQGQILLFDDTPGKEKIVVKTTKGSFVSLDDDAQCLTMQASDGNEYFHLDQKKKKITMETKNGDIDILCEKGTFTLKAKVIETKSSKDTKHTIGANLTHKIKSKWTGKADGEIDFDGKKIHLN